MPTLKIAHIQKQGQDMIIVPLSDDFEQRPLEMKNQAVCEIQAHARAAGLKGTVVPVWNHGGRMGFLAPDAWHPYFKSISLRHVHANLNRRLSW